MTHEPESDPEEAFVLDVVTNPIYAGLPPFPAYVTDDQWVSVAQKAMADIA